MQGEK